MAREDSVRGAVERIDKRTSDLAPVLENISDSLKNIRKAFAPKEESSSKKETRESLLQKFLELTICTLSRYNSLSKVNNCADISLLAI